MRTAMSSWTVRFGKTFFQNVRQVVVHHDGRDQTGVHHLEQVVVLEVLAARCRIATGGFPWALNFSLSASRLW